jgi:hypothetical protein
MWMEQKTKEELSANPVSFEYDEESDNSPSDSMLPTWGVTVLRPHRSGRPAWPSNSSSNTSSSSASQSALQAVAPDTPDRWTAWILAARRAARQEQYDKSAFPARLAEALRRHGMAVWVGRTSTHVMQGIINELAHLQRT